MAYGHNTSTDSAASLPPGLQIFGYTLLSVMGRGGFGVTYKARQESDGQIVVLKESLPRGCAFREPGSLLVQPKPGMEGDEPGCFGWAKTNFLNEAVTLNALCHPNIVQVLAAFEADDTGTAYYAMPLVSEHSLQDYIRKDGIRNRQWVLYLLSSLLGALNYIHNAETPLLHRDIKPENILIAESGRPILIDFGSARGTEVDLKTSIVTHSFSPIEQSKGVGEGPWTDIYSVGATMYYLITGTLVPPLDHRFPQESDAYRPLAGNAELEEVYGSVLLESIDKALAFDAEDRFCSALEWAQELQFDPFFQSSLAVVPPLAPTGTPAPGPVVQPGTFAFEQEEKKSKRGLFILIILLLLAALLAAGFLAYQHLKPEERGRELTYIPVSEPPAPLPEPTPVKKATAQLRILAKPGSQLYTLDTQQETNVKVPTLAIYYVVKEENGFYHIGNRPGEAASACLRKADAIEWKTSLAMRLEHPGSESKVQGRIIDHRRDVALYFNEPEGAEAYATHEDSVRAGIQKIARNYTNPNDFSSALAGVPQAAALGIIGREPLSWKKKAPSHLLPITGVLKDEEGFEKTVSYGGDPRRKSKIYQVAAMGKPRQDDTPKPATPTKAEKNVDVIFVVDTTKSMSPYIEGVKKSIETLIHSIKDPEKRVHYGIIGYRDFHLTPNGEVPTLEYVTRNFSPRPLPDEAFLSQVLPGVQASKKSTVGYVEDVFAGINAAMARDDQRQEVEWRKDATKIVWLIGDAPGREQEQREDSKLCSDKNRPVGTQSGLNFAGLQQMLKSHGIRVLSTFIATDQPHVRNLRAWKQYELTGQEQFQGLAYSTLNNNKPGGSENPADETQKDLQNHAYQLVDLIESSTDISAALKKGLMEGAKYIKLAADLDEDKLAEQFSNEALMPLLRDITNVVYGKPAELAVTQCLFDDAYVELLATRPEAEGAAAEPVPPVAQAWTLEKSVQGEANLEARVILTRGQFEHFTNLLQYIAEQLSNKSTDATTWNSLQKLMVVTLADPNLIGKLPATKQLTPEDINKFAGAYSDDDINAMLEHFPESTTSFINKLGTELTPQDRDAMLRNLHDNLSTLLEFGKSSEWVKDAGTTDDRLDFLDIPLNFMP